MSLPRISIVMPSFNQASYLEEAIVSILSQGYPNLEFMIFDGGSRDESPTIIKKYASSLAYWQSQPDRGQSDAIIQGFSRASGHLLGWINSDDALLPGTLARIAQAHHEHADCGLFGGNYILVDQAGRVTRCKRHPANADWFARHGIFAFNPPGSFFRRRDYEAVGGLRVDLHYAMDNDLYIRMATNGTRYAHVPHYLSVFRQHEAQKPAVHQAAALAETCRLWKELWPAPLNIYARQKRWHYLYQLWQAVNGNYLRMTLDTLKFRGQHWQTLPFAAL